MATFKYCDHKDHEAEDGQFTPAVAAIRVRFTEKPNTLNTQHCQDTCMEHLGEMLTHEFKIQIGRAGFVSLEVHHLTKEDVNESLR